MITPAASIQDTKNTTSSEFFESFDHTKSRQPIPENAHPWIDQLENKKLYDKVDNFSEYNTKSMSNKRRKQLQ